MRIIKALITIVLVILVPAFLYGVSLRGVAGNITLNEASHMTFPSGAFESSHERAPYALLLALADQKRTDLSKPLAEFGSPDVGVYKDKFYILFPPGLSLMLVPSYVIGKFFGFSQLFTYATIAFFALVNAILLYEVTRKVFHLPWYAAVATVYTYCFATTSWNYAITIYQHTPSVTCLLVCFLGAYYFSISKKWRFLTSSLVFMGFGVGTFLDFPNALILFPCVLWVIFSSFTAEIKNKAYVISFSFISIVASIWFFLLAAFHGYYNYLSFGNPLKFGQSTTRYEGAEKYALRLERLAREATASATLQVSNSSGSAFSILRENRIANGFYTLFLSDDKSIFFFSPVLLLSLVGFYLVRKKEIGQAPGVVLIATILADVFIYMSFSDPWGGWAYGPRYLIPAMAFLSVGIGFFLTHTRLKILAYPVYFFLFTISSAIAWLGVLTTNAIPPKVEAVPLKILWNYQYAIPFLANNRTTNFIYTTFFKNSFPLDRYFFAGLGIVGFIVCLAVLFGSLSLRSKK